MAKITIISAFVAGLLSFLSPCVLPIIPGYLSLISGLSVEELKTKKFKWRTLLSALSFILGFSLVFVLLGASATYLGKYLLQNVKLFNRIGGAIVMIFGFHLAGVLKIKWLNLEERFQLKKGGLSYGFSFIVGAAFAFGWSPCIGPILASILILASQQSSLWQGILLLAVYSLGLGVPFFLTALAIEFFLKFLSKFKKYLGILEVVSGLLLILLGYLIFTDQITKLAFLVAK